MNEEATMTATGSTGTSVQPTAGALAKAAKAPKASKAAEPRKAKAPKAPKASKVKAAKVPKVNGTGHGLTGPERERFLQRYHRDKAKKTPSGNPSVDCDDRVARALRGKALDEVYAIVAKALEMPVADLKAKYRHLNPGMQRMNLGNRYRAALA